MSTVSEQYDSQSYIPAALSNMGIRPTSCELNAKILEGNKTHYTYHLHWEENSAMKGLPSFNGEKNEVKNCSGKVVRPLKCGDTGFAEVDKIMFKAAKQMIGDNRSASSHPQAVRCDGPCGKEYPPAELQLLGRCDHYLCSLCSGIITNLDRSHGCSAFSCAVFRTYDFLPETMAKQAYDTQIRKKMLEKEEWRKESGKAAPKKKASCYSIFNLNHLPIPSGNLGPASSASNEQSSFISTSRATSEMSQKSQKPAKEGLFRDMSLVSVNKVAAPDEHEAVQVRLMLLERIVSNGSKKVYKKVLQDEVPARTVIKDAIGTVLGDRLNTLLMPNHACPLRLYFYAGLKSDPIRRLTCEQFESSTLLDFAHNHGSVHFVLDAADAVRKMGSRNARDLQ